jgi:hypothetical protein
MLKERRFFIKSGDVSASYLRPYQCLISQKDAGEVFLPLSTVDLSFVDNKLPLLKEQKGIQF